MSDGDLPKLLTAVKVIVEEMLGDALGEIYEATAAIDRAREALELERQRLDVATDNAARAANRRDNNGYSRH